MEIPKVFESEYRFCLILWEHEPIKSSELVALCKEQLGWKLLGFLLLTLHWLNPLMWLGYVLLCKDIELENFPIKTRLKRIGYPNDHGFAFYLGFDSPVYVEDTASKELSEWGGTIRIPITVGKS